MLIARQPILNRDLTLYGYELLFRPHLLADSFHGASAIHASASVMQSAFEEGFDVLVGNKKAFVNFDADVLQLPLIEGLDPNFLIIEVLETTDATPAVMKRLKDLSDKGYTIALDDFDNKIDTCPLVPLATIIKFDLLSQTIEDQLDEIMKAKALGKILLAEKVETYQLFEQAKSLGFQLFQGYFFAKPQIMTRPVQEFSQKANYISILEELQEDEPRYQKIAEIMERDVALSYKLMLVIQSRSDQETPYSIKRALKVMGLKEIERWIYVMMIQEMSLDRTPELTRLALLRAKFAERLVVAKGEQHLKYEAFMVGLFSVVEALTDSSFEEALATLAIPQRVKDALVSDKGLLGEVWRLIRGYETNHLSELMAELSRMGLSEGKVNHAYIEALNFTLSLQKTLII